MGDRQVTAGAFVQNNDIAYQSWYDAGDANIYPLTTAAPLSLQAYTNAFG